MENYTVWHSANPARTIHDYHVYGENGELKGIQLGDRGHGREKVSTSPVSCKEVQAKSVWDAIRISRVREGDDPNATPRNGN